MSRNLSKPFCSETTTRFSTLNYPQPSLIISHVLMKGASTCHAILHLETRTEHGKQHGFPRHVSHDLSVPIKHCLLATGFLHRT